MELYFLLCQCWKQPVLWWVDVWPAGGNVPLFRKGDLSAFTCAQMIHWSHRDEAGRQRATFLFLSFHWLWRRLGRVTYRSFIAYLRKLACILTPELRGWFYGLLIAGFYDHGCLWPCDRGGLCWEWKGKGELLLDFFISPSIRCLRKPQRNADTWSREWHPIKWFFMFLKRMSCFSWPIQRNPYYLC